MLRDYQAADVAALSPLVAQHRAVFHQLPTGGGKTAEVSEITRTVWSRDYRSWFVVPRNELLHQASEHFRKWGIPHGLIAAGREESRAFRVHVVSKDTLLRRLYRIKSWPDLIHLDEAHLYYDAQVLIMAAAPAQTKFIGWSATPERLDGRGLADLYQAIHYGPSIPWLTERGFLSPLRYFAPPIDGLDSVHRRGTEYDADELDELYKRRKVYGDVIRYYERHASVAHTGISAHGPTVATGRGYHRGRPALIFCRSVRSAYETAERFTQAGFAFFCIEGRVRNAERRRLIHALRLGEIDGLTNCELATYGLDIPRVEYGASIRPTLSRALYFQMVGRILRPYADPGTGVRKQEALFFDHANLVAEHTDASAPGVPLFYLPQIAWNFEGRDVRRRAPAETRVRMCPYLDYQYCQDPACAGGCKREPADARQQRQDLEVVPVALTERTPPRQWSVLEPAERQEVQDRVGRATDSYVEALQADPPKIDAGPVGELVKVAQELGRSMMWVYWHCQEAETARTGKVRQAINLPLLHEIARQARTKDGKPFKPGWVWMKRQEIERGIRESAELEEVRA